MAHVGQKFALGRVGCMGLYRELVRAINRVLKLFVGLG